MLLQLAVLPHVSLQCPSELPPQDLCTGSPFHVDTCPQEAYGAFPRFPCSNVTFSERPSLTTCSKIAASPATRPTVRGWAPGRGAVHLSVCTWLKMSTSIKTFILPSDLKAAPPSSSFPCFLFLMVSYLLIISPSKKLHGAGSACSLLYPQCPVSACP